MGGHYAATSLAPLSLSPARGRPSKCQVLERMFYEYYSMEWGESIVGAFGWGKECVYG